MTREPLAELPPRPLPGTPDYEAWLERENFVLRQIVERQASRARLWAGLGVVAFLAVALVLGALWGVSGSIKQTVEEGRVRGLKNRAVACAAVQAVHAPIPAACLDPELAPYFHPAGR